MSTRDHHRVLIVEDDSMIADVLGDIITSFGYETVWVSNGKDAINLVETQAFSVAVIDLELPEMPGTEVAKRLKRLIPQLKYIFSTGYSEQEDHIDPNDPGFYGVIRKPFEIIDIQAAIENALSNH